MYTGLEGISWKTNSVETATYKVRFFDYPSSKTLSSRADAMSRLPKLEQKSVSKTEDVDDDIPTFCILGQ